MNNNIPIHEHNCQDKIPLAPYRGQSTDKIWMKVTLGGIIIMRTSIKKKFLITVEGLIEILPPTMLYKLIEAKMPVDYHMVRIKETHH